MTEIIGIRFKDVGKVYYFAPNGNQTKLGDKVIVETARGVECGEVAIANRMVEDSEVFSPLKPVIRMANNADLRAIEQNHKKEAEAFAICQERIQKHHLEMKLVEVEYTFDGNKILFYFTADGRVDFRELVKDLASIFKTRIELRQIGVRDEAKMLGGLGICGRPFCCHTFLGDFQPVSIKMAKEQNLSLNPTKISGTCGRLMCCLKYEEEAYQELNAITPHVGAYVKTPEGRGVVVDSNLLSGVLSVRLDDHPDAAPHHFKREELQVQRRPRREDAPETAPAEAPAPKEPAKPAAPDTQRPKSQRRSSRRNK